MLPIEIVQTNRKALEGYYENIPECLSDKKEIACWLEKFASKTMNANRNDAKHLFFMGLAYLSGIDVEVNGERALELLTRFAKQNLPDAYERLVTIFLYHILGLTLIVFGALLHLQIKVLAVSFARIGGTHSVEYSVMLNARANQIANQPTEDRENMYDQQIHLRDYGISLTKICLTFINKALINTPYPSWYY